MDNKKQALLDLLTNLGIDIDIKRDNLEKIEYQNIGALQALSILDKSFKDLFENKKKEFETIKSKKARKQFIILSKNIQFIILNYREKLKENIPKYKIKKETYEVIVNFLVMRYKQQEKEIKTSVIDSGNKDG